jgi:hypothetical protein
MCAVLVPDTLWGLIEPLLPTPRISDPRVHSDLLEVPTSATLGGCPVAHTELLWLPRTPFMDSFRTADNSSGVGQSGF